MGTADRKGLLDGWESAHTQAIAADLIAVGSQLGESDGTCTKN